ncbi:MAG: hypothetical protein CL886_10300 [Dehalococcoidia bacterium]|nr:hypothetical protein [Dehalococcoidia bacterium]
MPTEGTGIKPPYPEDKPMAQVTYRGVKYDTSKSKQSSCNKSELTYRGVKFQKELCTA